MFLVSAAPLRVDLIINETATTARMKVAAILKTLIEKAGHFPQVKEPVIEYPFSQSAQSMP